MSIIDVIERVRREPPLPSPDGIFPDQKYVCKAFERIPWDRRALESTLGFEIPSELAELWNACGGLVLYEDDLYGQWGLVIFPPTDEAIFPPSESTFFNLNREFHEDKAEWILPGDLILGRFWGDRERPMIRCDKNAADYGSIFIVAEMDERPDWYKAASSLEEFLVKFMDAKGAKYWEYHYQKELAEKAALEAQRNK
jgi:hypothetical protein